MSFKNSAHSLNNSSSIVGPSEYLAWRRSLAIQVDTYTRVLPLQTNPQITIHFAMILNDTDKLVILFSFGLGLIVYLYSKTKHSSLPLPPGPKKLPFLGNLFDLPKSHEWLKYAEWCKQFSAYLASHPYIPKFDYHSDYRFEHHTCLCCWIWFDHSQFVRCVHRAVR